jgi:hypothetical protein
MKIDAVKSMHHIRTYMEFCTLFLNSSFGVEKFGAVDMNKIYCVIMCFEKTGAVKAMFFQSALFKLTACSDETRYNIALSAHYVAKLYEFREKWPKEGHTFLMGTNEITNMSVR